MLRLLSLLTILSGIPAFAEDGLEGTITEVPTAPSEENRQPLAPPESDAEEGEAPPPARYEPLPKPSPRFGLDDRNRFRHWLTSLCHQGAVGGMESTRLRFSHDRSKIISQATNRQGSLVLLLENYREMAAFRDDCIAKRKADPDACVERGRLPKPWDPPSNKRAPWLNFGSMKFWKEFDQNRTPAGIEKRTDLLQACRDQIKTIQDTLKKEFFELRDAADLDGKPGSDLKAKELVDAIRGDSTCGTSSISEGPEKPLKIKHKL